MIYRDVNPLSWAFKHGLSIKEYNCLKCSTKVTLDIPVQTKDWVGFEGYCKDCNPPQKMSYLKPTDPEKLKIIQDMY